jgi:enoyl-CoA hydratase/carnithine racemase
VPELEYTVESRIARIVLNRPERKNAFTLPMVDRWAAALHSAAGDPAVRAVVVTGAGSAFCAGIDLSVLEETEDTPVAHRRMLADRIHQVARAVEELDKPLIAAVNGAAVGAGMDMALMCDIRFASAAASFSEGYVRIGLVPGDGGSYYLPRIVGEAKALELLWTGDFVDAEESARIGLSSRVYAPDELLPAAIGFASRLAELPPLSVDGIKASVRRARSQDARASLDMLAWQNAVVMASEDHREALAAFRERRPGRYLGRLPGL